MAAPVLANAEVEESLKIIEDGFWIDAETGEVLGLADPAAEAFAVTDRKSAEWVLEKMAFHQSLAEAHAARLIALAANIEKQQKTEEQKVAFFAARYGGQLRKFAEGALAGQKGKTCQLDHGKIELRDSRQTYEVTRTDLALSFAKEVCPDAVQVKEWVNKTDVLASIEDPASCPFLRVVPSVSYANVKVLGATFKIADAGAEVCDD